MQIQKFKAKLSRSLNKRIFAFIAKICPKFAPVKPNLALKNVKIPKSPKSILIMPLYFAVGDLIIFSPLAKTMREYFKDAHITLMVISSAKDLAQMLLKSYIDEFIIIDKGEFLDKESISYSLKFLSTLKKREFELCINFVDDRYKKELRLISYTNAAFKVAVQNSLRYSDCKGFWRIKERDDSYYTHLLPSTKAKFEFLKWAEFLGEILAKKISPKMRIDKALLPKFESSLKEILGKVNLNERFSILKNAPFAVLFVGASMDVRKWDLENFAAVGEYLAKKHDKHIFICSGFEDKERGESIKNAILASFDKKLVLNLCGATNLAQLGAILNRADLLVSNETSCVHYAAMLGKKLVVLCQGNLLGRYCPYPSDTKGYHVVYHPEIKPNSLEKFYKKFEKGSNLNINDISVKAVKKAVDEALGENL